ncbi:MAG: hypoxanthine phosphoribosyltransferase [Bacteroidota bacterium]
MQTVQIFEQTFSEVITEAEIKEKIQSLAEKITADYASKNPLFIALLNGAFMFAADLFRQIQIPAEISFVKLSSYNGLQSTGNIETVIGLKENITGRHIIILDDILDTGKTLFTFKKEMIQKKPLSIKTVLLIDKKNKIEYDRADDYSCFENNSGFLIGYGMDFNGHGRNLPSIYQLKE